MVRTQIHGDTSQSDKEDDYEDASQGEEIVAKDFTRCRSSSFGGCKNLTLHGDNIVLHIQIRFAITLDVSYNNNSTNVPVPFYGQGSDRRRESSHRHKI